MGMEVANRASRILLPMMLFWMLPISLAGAQDGAPAPAPRLLDGWNETTIAAQAEGCRQSYLARAKEDLQEESRRTGRPVKAIPDSYAVEVGEMCQCVVRYVASRFTLRQAQDTPKIVWADAKQSLYDGRCTPRGQLGKEIAEAREREMDKRAFSPEHVDPAAVRKDLEKLCASATQFVASWKSTKQPERCEQVYKLLGEQAETATLKTSLKLIGFADMEERSVLLKLGIKDAAPGAVVCESLLLAVSTCR